MERFRLNMHECHDAMYIFHDATCVFDTTMCQFHDRLNGLNNILYIQVNGVPVNTGCGSKTMELCEDLPRLREMITEMATGNTMFGVSLLKRLKLQLVPRCLHQGLLASIDDCYKYSQVFMRRTETRSNGPYYESLPKASDGAQQFFLLRAIAISGCAEQDGPNAAAAVSGVQKLAFLVKVFNTDKDKGFRPGLKLGLVYADALFGDHSTVKPYVHEQSAAQSPSQGPNIVMPKPMPPSPPADPAPRVPLNTQRKFKAASPHSVSPEAGSRGHGKRSSISPRPLCGAGPGLQAGESGDGFQLTWVEDTRQPPGPHPKKTKLEGIVGLRPRFPSSTCESVVPASVAKALRHLTRDQFGVQHVMDGHAAVPVTALVGHELRQDRAAVWAALYAFWSSLAMQSVAGVLALVLDGYGHGKMNLLVKLQYSGCCGRWDMMAVWAAKYLGLFPPKYVSTPHTCTPLLGDCCVQFHDAMTGLLIALH